MSDPVARLNEAAPWILAVVILASQGAGDAKAQGPEGNEPGQASWAGSATLGYSTGIGPDFGGGSSVGFTAGLFRVRSSRFALGLEAGYSRLGGTTSDSRDFAGPGSLLSEEFNWSVAHAAAVARFALARSSIRPVGILGVGLYMPRSRDEIKGWDGNGVRIPFYDFFETRSEIKPGASVGLAVEFPDALGSLTIGAEARWHAVFTIGPGGVATADFATIAVGVGFE